MTVKKYSSSLLFLTIFILFSMVGLHANFFSAETKEVLLRKQCLVFSGTQNAFKSFTIFTTNTNAPFKHFYPIKF